MSKNKVLSFDIPDIMSYQRNRYPMLFIDQVTECVPLEYAKGYKLFTYNEWYFHGYEIESPKVWNVIQIEAMSQMFLMTFLTTDDHRGYIAASNKFNNVQFFRKIEPGDKLELEATLNSFRHAIARGKVEGKVGNEPACSMECTIVLPEVFSKYQRKLLAKSPTVYRQENAPSSNIEFGIKELKECMLNKYPWLFIDRVLEIEPGKFVRAIKNFTYNERYFPSHFPEDPNVPGFIQIESCMQSFLLTFLSIDKYKRSETSDRLLNNIKVKRKIIPGETLEIHAKLERFSRGVAEGYVESFVNGEEAVSLEITAVLTDELDKFKSKLRNK